MSDLELMFRSFPSLLLAGLKMTIPLTALAFALSLVIAVITALIQYAKVPVLKQIARVYIWIIRGTPLLVQLFVAFYGLPSIGFRVNAFATAVVVMGINEGAYMAETLRGCLEAVPKGQLEAGYCVGMNYRQIMWHVVLPQAIRTAVPALGNSIISMLKDTSLTANITVAEMFSQTERIAGRNYRFMAMYLTVAIIYLLFSTVLTWVQKLIEKKMQSYGAERK
jgi:cystine transport system permease protein